MEAASALIADEPPPRDGIELTRIAAARLGKTVLELEDVTVMAGQRDLLRHVTWQLGPGERVGVVGANGSGKTTLLQLLAGILPVPSAAGGLVSSGTIARGQTVRLGYLTQEPPPVDPGLRALEAAQQVRGSLLIGRRETSASQLLDRLGLRGDRQWTPVGELSGGERRRLQLLMVLMSEPNVLLLDEATNDLDIETLTELEDMLDGWAGSVVAVSHDRYFLERVTDHVVALVDGGLPYLPGGVDEYLELRDRRRAGRPDVRGPEPAVAREPAGAASSAGSAPSAAARQRTGQKELVRLERQLARLSDTEAKLNAALAENAADYERLIELGAQHRAVQAEKAELEERWLTIAEELSQ
jgi:ATP-binding cassette subfamily F protein uup